MIPVKQTVKIKKAVTADDWGQATPGSAKSYKCRIDESSELVRSSDGKEVVSKAFIMFLGLVAVSYSDTIEYTDEIGNFYSFNPLSVSVIRDFTGKPLLTKVVV